MTIYRSQQGKEQILKLYDQNWADLGLETEHRTIPTRFGETHVVITGPSDGQPILVFHGGNMISPISFAWITQLTSQYRVYAPDTVGHPGYSAETRLKPGSFQYGEWASEVISGLNLHEPVVLGGSYGAGIVLNLAANAPQQIGKAVLLVPSGFAPIPMLPLITKIGFPMIMYQWTHDRVWLVHSLSPMNPDPAENVVEVTGAIYKHLKLEADMPRRISCEDLKYFHAPTLVLAGENDILFPPKIILPCAHKIIPNLVAAEVIPGSTHFIPQRSWGALCQRIDHFIKQGI